jgi:uncharacterized SAM-binding protein YcdF (DUF218 family)
MSINTALYGSVSRYISNQNVDGTRMEWLITNLVASVFLPPLNLIILGGVGCLLLKRARLLATVFISASLVLLFLLSTPMVSDRLIAWLERDYAPLNKGSKAEAIVVLGAGRYFEVPEYDGDTVDALALERLRYAARLYKATGRPILVTGGMPGCEGESEGELMKAALEQDFGVPVRWAETSSNNTMENARFSHDILSPHGIRRIYLVTHAWHMPRAELAFRKAGFDVVPAGTLLTLPEGIGLFDLLPQPKGLLMSYYALHEMLGLVWYRLRWF